MTLRWKTLLSVGITLVTLFVVLYFAASNILLNSYIRLEQQEVRDELQRTLNAINYASAALNQTADDWAGWDDTYEFIQNNNPAYYVNFGNAGIAAIHLNLMVYIQPSGRILYGTGFDSLKKTKVPLPAEFRKFLSSPASLFLRNLDEKSSRTGLVLLSQGPVLIAARPIVTNEKTGPVRGTLIFGRNFNSEAMREISKLIELPLFLRRLDEKPLPADFQHARTSLSPEQPILVHPLNSDVVAGYALLRDISGKPILILRADIPRGIYYQGVMTVRYLFLMLFIVSFIFCAMTLLLLERGVLQRLSRLSSAVSHIRDSGDVSARIPVQGKDELSNLMANINNMLAAVEDVQRQLRKSEEHEKHVAALMRGVLAATDELLVCRDIDAVMRRGVELAREKLGVERCSLARIRHSARSSVHQLVGTYGTNMHRETTDERIYSFQMQDWLLNHPQLAQGGHSGWTRFEDQELFEWDGEKTVSTGKKGWVGVTLIQSGPGLIGVLFNDTAISGAELDIIQQETLAIYCSLLANIIEHKQAEAQLQQVASSARCLLWQATVVAHEDELHWETVVYNPEAAEEFLPLYTPPGGDYSDGFYHAVLEEDRPYMNKTSSHALRMGRRAYTQEYRMRLMNGEIRWIYEDVRIKSQGEGRWVLTGVCTDITDRKQAEATRQVLLRRLVTAQEEERRRIARELHDQIGQDSAALLLGLKSLPEQNELPRSAVRHVQELQEVTRHLMQQARRLALDLRPETLDRLGLPTVLNRHTQEWMRRSGIAVDFHSHGFENRRLAPDIEMTIYRVVQEALTNIVRHAAAKQVSVLLEHRGSYVLTIIEDDGQGFVMDEDKSIPEPQHGLGFMGMFERVSLVNGTLKVESHPGAGTTIFVRIPLLDMTTTNGDAKQLIENVISNGAEPAEV